VQLICKLFDECFVAFAQMFNNQFVAASKIFQFKMTPSGRFEPGEPGYK
jgi:hypothetical protein